MKLSEYKGEAALDVLADLIEPAVEIFSDKEFSQLIQAKQSAKAAKAAIKGHKKAVLTIMAVIDGEDPETYSPGVFVLPVKLLKILNDPEMMSLFTFAADKGATASESASESTEGE